MEKEEKKFIVINNETGKEKEFKTFDEANRYVEHLVFGLGIDAEIQ